MKKINIFTFLFFASFALLSCSSDDDNGNGNGNNTEENYFSYGNTEFDIADGILVNYGEWQGAYVFVVGVLTTEMSIVNGEFVPEDNIASSVSFELHTDNPDDVAIGTYVYSETEEAGTFSFAEAGINYNYEEEITDAFKNIEEGTVEIIQNGTTHEIIFNCVTVDGVEVNGHYEGTLEYIDNSED